ncbi:ecdysone 20-monooxygenase [Rhipicephalus microplus]|uniref:ecdysone 20-monooxygenase n=1 Tax=Rhipicephalus microplus TaxID=6941 RepID=UPI003F6B4570
MKRAARALARSVGSEAVSLGAAAAAFHRIPGPKPSLPFIGTSWQYSRWGRYNLYQLHEASTDKYYRYGDLMKEEYQWQKPVVHSFNPDDFQVIFQNQGRWPDRPPNEFVCKYRNDHPEKYNSVGLSNAHGQEWHRLRMALAPVLLEMKNIAELATWQEEICNDFAEYVRWLRGPNTLEVDCVQDALSRLALESIFRLCLDTRLGCLQPLRHEQGEAQTVIDVARQLFSAYQQLYYGLPVWKYVPTPSYQRYTKAEDVLYKITLDYMQQYAKHAPHDQNDKSLLQALLDLDGLSAKDIHLTIMDFIIGGVFTTSIALCFLLHHLASNQDVQEKLYSELKSGNISSCAYLRACIKESFRLSPTVPGVMRVLPEDVVLSGYRLPAGVPVFANSLVTCRLEKYFPQPEQFRPERWLGEARGLIHPFSLLPFGHGARMCVGRRFAELELMTTAAKMVQNFIIEPCTQRINTAYVFVVVPSHPVRLRFIDRN